MIFTKDNLRLGLVLGLIGPVLGLLIIKMVKPEFSGLSLRDFLDTFLNTNRLLTSIGSLSLLANVILFTLYVNTQRDKTAKGIFLVTLIYGIAILVLKILN